MRGYQQENKKQRVK